MKITITLLLLFSIVNTQAQKSKLLGSWKANNGTLTTFYKNTVKMGGDTYTYEVNGQYLTMYNNAGQTVEYTWKVQGKTLKLTMPGYGTFTLTKVSKGTRHTAHSSRSRGNKLVGTWQATSGTYMVFTKTNMQVNNLNYAYTLQGNNIIVNDGQGNTETFTYSLSDNKMTLNIPNVGTYYLQKVNNRTARSQNTGYNQTANTAGASRLYGSFCNYSSSATGGYSTTRKITFDGRGHYTYGSQSAYSSGGDGYYGGDGGYSGTYQVVGNKGVILTGSDGTQYRVAIHYVQNSGEITELSYDGTVYGKSLCD